MLEIVITGGQTGVDQAGWRAAREAGFSTGGWMPAGFRTEDGPHPEFAALYGAREHKDREFRMRTQANVGAADAVAWLGTPFSRGGRLTLELARLMDVPTLIVEAGADGRCTVDPARFVDWLDFEDVRTLMIAGNRESTSPGFGAWAERYLSEVFRLLAARE